MRETVGDAATAPGGARPAFDPYRVQWRSDRLEWVVKNGFVDWFLGATDD